MGMGEGTWERLAIGKGVCGWRKLKEVSKSDGEDKQVESSYQFNNKWKVS